MAVRPTFMGFETATRGIMTNQKALDIVGNNLGNIGVTGYTRQRVDQVSLNVNLRYTRFNTNATPFAGQGVGIYGVSQIRDAFLDKRFREEYADVGYYSTTSAVLEDLSASMDEIEPSTISVALTKFQDAWNELLGKAANEVSGAANLLAQATKIVSVFQQMSAKIDNVWNQQEYSLKLETEKVNSILRGIAELNDTISQQSGPVVDPTNDLFQPLELLDQRNVLLDELSQYTGIYYETQADGQVTVWAGTKDPSNTPIVQGKRHSTLMMDTNADDPSFKTVSLFWGDSGKPLQGNNSGILQGALDMLNGRGLSADGRRGENHEQGILYYKDKIDQFAKTIVQEFNNVVEIAQADPVTGEPLVDADGNPVGYEPPRYKAMFSFDMDGFETAAGLRVNPDWLSDSAYIVSNILDKLGGQGADDNSYAAKVSQLFEKTMDFGEFRGTMKDYITFYSVTRLGNAKDFADTRMEATATVADNLLNQIQQISGVSMDEEGVDMMQYQKAYDAVSRVFTTLDEMLDKLINGTGVVGR